MKGETRFKIFINECFHKYLFNNLFFLIGKLYINKIFFEFDTKFARDIVYIGFLKVVRAIFAH